MKKNLFSTSISVLILLCVCSCGNRNSNKTKQVEDIAISELKTVLINGDSIHYIDIGKGDPVVFVHGTVGDYRTWHMQMDTFSKNHRVIAYSRRYAYPNKQVINDSADYSAVPHAKDLAELIKALDLGSVHLVGHSYGALTALLTTIKHPELIRSVTLGEPPVMSLLQHIPGGDTLANNFTARAIIPAAEAFINNNDEKAVIKFLGGVMGDSLFYSRIPLQGQDMMLDNTLELRGIALSTQNSTAIGQDDLKAIKIPVLLLKGDRSPLILTSIVDEIDRCLKNKVFVTLPNSSHGLQAENPLEFNKIVLDFINKH